MTGGEIMKLKREGVNTMLAKIEFATYMTYWKIKRRFMEMANEEDGMETLEAVILIGIAVLVAVVIYGKLVGEGADDKNSVIGNIFGKIDEKIKKLFG